MNYKPRTASFLKWLCIGVFAVATPFVLISKWPVIAPLLTGSDPFIFDQQPPWLKTTRSIIEHMAWLIGFALFVFCCVRRTFLPLAGYITGSVATFVLLFAMIVFRPTLDNFWHRQAFNAEEWKDSKKSGHTMWPPRLCMIDSLMDSRQLNGMASNQVIDLLGPPADKSFPYGASQCDVHYYLGPERGFMRIDSEWLFIKFGEDGKVKRTWLYKD